MSILTPQFPSIVHHHRFCDNGQYPDATFYAGIQARLNHLVAYRRKPVFQRTCPLGTAGGTTGAAWRWYCRTGYGCKRFAVMAVLGLDDRNVAVDPYLSVAITEVGGSALSPTPEFHYGASRTTATDAPDEWSIATRYLTCSANTEYTGAVTFNDNVRVISLLVFEDFSSTVDDTVDYFSTYQPAGGSPIYDNRIGQQLQAVGGLLRRNSGIRSDWTPVDGTALTRVSSTYVNLVDNATTGTPVASSPGNTYVTSYHNTYSSTTVPIKMCVYGSQSSGTGHVVLRDTSGNDAADVSVTGAAGWYTATGALTVGTGQKYDLMFKSDSVGTITVNAVSMFEVT